MRIYYAFMGFYKISSLFYVYIQDVAEFDRQIHRDNNSHQEKIIITGHRGHKQRLVSKNRKNRRREDSKPDEVKRMKDA